MMDFLIKFLATFIFLCFFSGCSMHRGPLTASFANVTGATATNQTVTGQPSPTPNAVVAPLHANLVIMDNSVFDFGSSVINSAKTKDFVITNTGAENATQLVFSAPVGGGYSVVANNCPLSNGSLLAPNGSCTITIKFVPTVVGPFPSSFSFNYYNGASTLSVAKSLQGTGTATPLGQLSSTANAPYAMGEVDGGGTLNSSLTFQNIGSASLTFGSATVPTGSPFTVTSSCANGAVVAVGATCTLSISFYGIPAVGIALPQIVSETVTLSYNDSASNKQIGFGLTATIKSAAPIAVLKLGPSDATRFLGIPVNPAVAAKMCIVVSNVGAKDATGVNFGNLAAPFYYSTVGACPYIACTSVLAAGQSCAVPIEFVPNAPSAFSKVASVIYNNGVGLTISDLSIVGTTVLANCNQIHLANSSLPSGLYTIQPDPGSPALLTAYCDMVTAGGGWTLVLNYLHKGGTNPNLNSRTSALPKLGGSALGTDEQGSETWGHAAPALLSKLNFSQTRFFCKTSDHSRTIDFFANASSLRDYFRSGGGGLGGGGNIHASDFGGITKLSTHSAYLPDSANYAYSDQHDNALTEYPFFQWASRHWSMRGQGYRWECDNWVGSEKHTYHQIWIR